MFAIPKESLTEKEASAKENRAQSLKGKDMSYDIVLAWNQSHLDFSNRRAPLSLFST